MSGVHKSGNIWGRNEAKVSGKFGCQWAIFGLNVMTDGNEKLNGNLGMKWLRRSRLRLYVVEYRCLKISYFMSEV